MVASSSLSGGRRYRRVLDRKCRKSHSVDAFFQSLEWEKAALRACFQAFLAVKVLKKAKKLPEVDPGHIGRVFYVMIPLSQVL